MDNDAPIDAIVVLGTKVCADGNAGARLEARTRHALALFAENRTARLVFSGGPPGAEPPEAEAMARLADAAGVPRDRLLLESHSASTWDNARLTAALLRDRGCVRILLVTDSLHMPRAALTFRATGLTVVTSAIGWRSARGPAARLTGRLYEGAATLLYRLRLLHRRRDLTG